MGEQGRLADPGLPGHEDEAPAWPVPDLGERILERCELVPALDEPKFILGPGRRRELHEFIFPGIKRGCNRRTGSGTPNLGNSPDV